MSVHKIREIAEFYGGPWDGAMVSGFEFPPAIWIKEGCPAPDLGECNTEQLSGFEAEGFRGPYSFDEPAGQYVWYALNQSAS